MGEFDGGVVMTSAQFLAALKREATTTPTLRGLVPFAEELVRKDEVRHGLDRAVVSEVLNEGLRRAYGREAL